jgi:TolA-binding protein
VDALLMLGRDRDALALLQTLALQARGRDQELRVVRGELAAAASCARAISDFDAVLAGMPAPALAERALYGRATCLARLGDAPAAARDLRAYVRRFPDGRFAAEARRALGEGRSGGDL